MTQAIDPIPSAPAPLRQEGQPLAGSEHPTLRPVVESLRDASTTSPARLTFLASAVGIGALALHAAAGGEPDLAVDRRAVARFGRARHDRRRVPVGSRCTGASCSADLPGSARVALTFDDGPHPVTTRRVLEALAPTRHRATFFVLGEKVRRHPDVVREIHAGGHTLGIHGDCHDRLHSFRMPGAVRDEIRRASDAVEAATGTRPRFFRPPLGHTSLTTVRGARRAGCHARRLVVARLRRHPPAKPGRRRKTHRPNSHRRRDRHAPRCLRTRRLRARIGARPATSARTARRAQARERGTGRAARLARMASEAEDDAVRFRGRSTVFGTG